MTIAIGLQLRKNKLRWLAKALLCFLVMGNLLLSAAMASSPALHKFIHHDADSEGHTCLATIIANGHVLSTQEPTELLILICAVFVLVLAESLLPHFERDLRLPIGRAPPQA